MFVSVTLSPFSSVFGWSSVQGQTEAFRSDFVDGTGSVAAHSDALVPSVFMVVRSDSAVASNGFLSTHFLINFSVADRISAQLFGSESFTPPDVVAGREGAIGLLYIIGIVVGALLLLVVVVAGIWYFRRKRWPSLMDYSASSIEFDFESHDLTGPAHGLGTLEDLVSYDLEQPGSWQVGVFESDGRWGLPDVVPNSSVATFLGE
jgi:hypothetical protein